MFSHILSLIPTTKSTTKILYLCISNRKIAMASVCFNLRPNKTKNPQIQLIYRLDSDRKKVVIGTGLHVPTEYWNAKKMRVRETTGFSDYEDYNIILGDWEKAVNEVSKIFRLKGLEPSKQQFKEEIIRQMKGESISQGQSNFLAYFEDFIKLKEAGETKKSTIKEYRGALNKINQYRRKKLNGRNLEFSDLRESFFKGFIKYLLLSLEANTVHKVIKRIRAVLNHATKKGINKLLDYQNEDCQVSYVKQPKIYLTEEEIDLIRQVPLEPFSRLDKVRDRFLIGYRTGQRYSDFKRISIDHVTSDGETSFIEILTVKGSKFIKIPLSSEVRDIIAKHNGYPPQISEAKFNEYLKELGELAGVVQWVSREEHGIQVRYQKWQLMSSHICRRSFATNGFKNGIHPTQLMPITGHQTVQMFMNYICISDDENSEMLSKHLYFS